MHLGEEAARYGLKLHLGKTKILTNVSALTRPETVLAGEQSIAVLGPADAERYLGRKLTLDTYHEAELANRIAAGWASFHKNKHVLSNRNCSLGRRLKAFDALITPKVLYGCASWTMWADSERRLRSARRSMLRKMIAVGRRHDEPWVEYIQRATHRCERLAKEHRLQEWVNLQRHRKWDFAGKCARLPHDRWSKRVLSWVPWFRCNTKRQVGRPTKRWSDDIAAIAGRDWMSAAKEKERWHALQARYINREI